MFMFIAKPFGAYRKQLKGRFPFTNCLHRHRHGNRIEQL